MFTECNRWFLTHVQFTKNDSMKALKISCLFFLISTFGLAQGTKLNLPKGSHKNIEESYEYSNELEIFTLDLTQTAANNSWFDGSYTSAFIPNEYGAYSSGNYSGTADFRVEYNDLNYNNFYVETEFIVDKYQNAPVFSLSAYYRMIELNLTDKGTIELAVNNSAKTYDLGSYYGLNKWCVTRVEVYYGKISVYIDGNHVLSINANLIRNESSRKADFSTTSFGNGAVLEGYLYYFSIGYVY